MEEENKRILEFARQQQQREEERMEKKKQQEESMAAVQQKVSCYSSIFATSLELSCGGVVT